MNYKRATLNYIYENFDNALERKNEELFLIKEASENGKVYALCSEETMQPYLDMINNKNWLNMIRITLEEYVEADYIIRNPVEYFIADLNQYSAHLASEISAVFDYLPDIKSWEVLQKKIQLSFMTQKEMSQISMYDVASNEEGEIIITKLDYKEIDDIKKSGNRVGIIVDDLADLIEGAKTIARKFVGEPIKLRYCKGHTLLIV